MSFHLHLLSTTLLLAVSSIHAQSIAPSLASQYSLSSSTTLPFPTATLSSTDTADLLKSKWSLAKAKVQQGQDNMAFVADPFPSSSPSSSLVLQVTYPQGSFSHDTGGTQFINLFNGSTPFNSMLLTYDLAFDKDFQFVKGGKLPGLRGGSQLDGCSGGKASDGVECFSTRLMWRNNGAGEVYAYIPDQSSLCSNSAIQCNDDGFGTSIQRGRINFLPGKWQSLALFVQMNEPADTANGYIALYYNDVKAIEQGGLQIRTNENLNIGGMYFSTFFGGDDDSWATPITTHTYYKNIQLFAGASASTMQGSKVSSAPRLSGAGVVSLLVGIVAARLLSSGM